MSIKEQIMKSSGKFLNACKNNNGLFLFGAFAVAWALASTAQTVGLALNKKIPKEEKKFLIPQEIMDGTFNIASYAAITLPLIAGVGKLAQKKFPTDSKAIEGAKCLAAVAGGILSSNIITPLLRNKTGVWIKNKFGEKAPLKTQGTTLYDTKPYPYFKANEKPLTMANYINMTKTYSGSLKI